MLSVFGGGIWYSMSISTGLGVNVKLDGMHLAVKDSLFKKLHFVIIQWAIVFLLTHSYSMKAQFLGVSIAVALLCNSALVSAGRYPTLSTNQDAHSLIHFCI